MLNRIARPFVYFVEKFYPDPLIFAIGLTFIAFIMVFIFTDASPIKAISSWGSGFSALMAFIGQLSFTLLATNALANTRPVSRFLQKLSAVPTSAFWCYALACFVTGIASWFAWAFGLVVGGIIAKNVQYVGQKRGLKLHYPLMVAAAYSGFVVWHMGYSGSIQLFIATKGHVFEKIMGIIPVSQTMFAGYNLIGLVLCLITIPLLMGLMKPKEDECVGLTPEVLERVSRELNPAKDPPPVTVGERIERWRWISFIMGLMLAIYLTWHFYNKGLDLNLNIVNWSFLVLGLLLADSPIHYVRLISEAGRTAGQIILQYPFYAGLMGLMVGTGLAAVMSNWFIAIATANTLPFWAFFSGGFLNMFIPSGGGQWAVQAPIFLDAAKVLGVDYSYIANAIAYGDQWTNMIQPFWTIPMLAIAGLKMRDMMGYTFITMIWSGVIFAFVLLVLI